METSAVDQMLKYMKSLRITLTHPHAITHLQNLSLSVYTPQGESTNFQNNNANVAEYEYAPSAMFQMKPFIQSISDLNFVHSH